MKRKKMIWGLVLTTLSVVTFIFLFFVNIPYMSEEMAWKIMIVIFLEMVIGVFLLGSGRQKTNYSFGDLKNQTVFKILHVTTDFEDIFPCRGKENILIKIDEVEDVIISFSTDCRDWDGDTPKEGQFWKKIGGKLVQQDNEKESFPGNLHGDVTYG